MDTLKSIRVIVIFGIGFNIRLMILIVIVIIFGSPSLLQSVEGSKLITTEVNSNTFISKWDTRLLSWESSASNQLKLPLESTGTYSFFVNWGDGTNDMISSSNEAAVRHTYVSEGVYTVTIDGTLIGWSFNSYGDNLKIIEISQWGNIRLGNSGSYFAGSSNLQLTATDTLDLTKTQTLNQAFRDCTNLGKTGNMNNWDVSGVTNMGWMFYSADSFNQPIGNWDVSSVTSMSSMFEGAHSFNQPIGNWDTARVMGMDFMFLQASAFNQPIGDWDVSQVYHMDEMFHSASSFNQPIGDWDVSRAYDMGHMFNGAFAFNQSIDDWDVSNIKRMDYMFKETSSFNQPLGNWDVSSVTNMDYMFNDADSFNQPIGEWDVSSVRSMIWMFGRARSFDRSIGNWDVSGVSSMVWMFTGVSLSTINYNNLLAGWGVFSLRSDVSFDAGNSQYSNIQTRQSIIDKFGWTIIDGGFNDNYSPPSDETTATPSNRSTQSIIQTENEELILWPHDPYPTVLFLIISFLGILAINRKIPLFNKLLAKLVIMKNIVISKNNVKNSSLIQNVGMIIDCAFCGTVNPPQRAFCIECGKNQD